MVGPPVAGPQSNAIILVTGVGFGVNVQTAFGIPAASDIFTNQIFYLPAIPQNGVAVGTATFDPSAAQAFIPQTSTVLSLTNNESYTNDSTASSIIRGDIFDAATGVHFLVIDPFQNVFPLVEISSLTSYHMIKIMLCL